MLTYDRWHSTVQGVSPNDKNASPAETPSARGAFIDFSLPDAPGVGQLAVGRRERSSHSVGSTVSIHSDPNTESSPAPPGLRLPSIATTPQSRERGAVGAAPTLSTLPTTAATTTSTANNNNNNNNSGSGSGSSSSSSTKPRRQRPQLPPSLQPQQKPAATQQQAQPKQSEQSKQVTPQQQRQQEQSTKGAASQQTVRHMETSPAHQQPQKRGRQRSQEGKPDRGERAESLSPSPELNRTRPVTPTASSFDLLEHVKLDRENLQAKYDDLQARAQALSLELAARKQDREDYQRVLQTLKAQLATTRQENLSLETRMCAESQDLRQQNLQLEADNTRLDVELDKVRSQLGKVHDSEDLLPELQQSKAVLQEQLRAAKESYAETIRKLGQERDDAVKELRSQMAKMRMEHNTRMHEATSEADELRRQMEEQANTLQQQLQDATDENTGLKTDFVTLRERRRQEQQHFDELRRRDKETWQQREQELRTAHERAMQSLRDEFEEDITGLKQRLLSGCTDEQSKAAELESKVQQLQGELEHQQHLVSARDATIVSLQEDVASTHKEAETVLEENEALRQEQRQLRDQVAGLAAEHRTLLAARDDWERRAREVDRNASAHVDNLDAQLHHAQQQIQVLQEQRDAALNSRDEYADVLHQRVEEVRLLQQQVATLRRERYYNSSTGSVDAAQATESERRARQLLADAEQRVKHWRERAATAEERASQVSTTATRLQQQVEQLQTHAASASSASSSARESPGPAAVCREEYDRALKRVQELERELRLVRQQRSETAQQVLKIPQRNKARGQEQVDRPSGDDATAKALRTEVEELKNRVEYLQSANEALKEAVAMDDSDEPSLKSKMVALQEELERTRFELSSMSSALKTKTAEQKDLRAVLNRLENELDAKSRQLEQGSAPPSRGGSTGDGGRGDDVRRLRDENGRLAAECEEWKRKFAYLRGKQLAPSGTSSVNASFDASHNHTPSSSVQGTPFRRVGSLRRAKANCNTYG